MKTLLGLVLCISVALGCTASQGSAAVSAVPQGVAFALCVLNEYGVDEAQKMSAADEAVDILAKCGGDAAQVIDILDAHKAAEMDEMVQSSAPTPGKHL